jgi:histidine triad (HIT) family protein
VPKIHIESLNGINRENIEYAACIFEKIPEIAKTLGIFESGYRVITAVGKDGGQSVFHLHFHVIGGKKLAWSF